MTYEPDWISPPGETILQLLSRLKLEKKDFLGKIGLDNSHGEMLFNGSCVINEDIAEKLQNVTGVKSAFWLNRESVYRNKLSLFKEEQFSWLERLPTIDLVKQGLIPKFLKKEDKLKACLDFFGVSTIDEWDTVYSRKMSIVSFRTSSSFDTVPESVIAWLRGAELQVNKLFSNSWSPEKLKVSIPRIRALTREKSPQIFLPMLRNILSDCGVKLAIVPTITGTRASGATYFLSPNQAILILSFRYKKDDHFWFSLFHEIGHLLLHGNKSLFIEDPSLDKSKEEQEADDFAESILIPKEYKSEMLSFRSSDLRKILKFAKKLNIAPGIVVGQLQHYGNVPHSYLNKVKVTYGKDAFFSL